MIDEYQDKPTIQPRAQSTGRDVPTWWKSGTKGTPFGQMTSEQKTRLYHEDRNEYDKQRKEWLGEDN